MTIARTRLTEKIIRSTKNTSSKFPIILTDSDVRNLQVHIGKNKKTYRFVGQINKIRYNKKIDTTNHLRLADARTWVQNYLSEINNDRHILRSNIRISKACTLFLMPYYTNFVKDKNPLGIIKNFIIKYFGDYPIAELTPIDIQNIIYILMKDGYAPETIRKYTLVGKTLYKQLIKHRRISFNPFNDLDLPKVSNIRTVVLTHVQRQPFIQCCHDENSVYADLLIFLLFTGLRLTEGIHVRLEDISDDYATLTLPKTKAGVVQYITLNSLAQEVLHRREDLTWNQYLFPSSIHEDKPITAPKGCFLRIKERMKVIGHDIDDLHIHDLRRSFASACAEVTNGDMHMVASQLRHSSTNILRRYVHYQPANIAIASEATAQALISPVQTQHESEAKP